MSKRARRPVRLASATMLSLIRAMEIGGIRKRIVDGVNLGMVMNEMNDITLCATRNCPLCDTCLRAHTKPDKYQSFAAFEWRAESEMWNGHAVIVAHCDYEIKMDTPKRKKETHNG
ncbi:MAG: hypothetical protein EOO38_04215 [Cytophagaceae bacterium]|jgi:hypothetical protein|nr:MAG: hypothetical protein EOO38_04215 [Cytophagaceae bacterium]